MAKRKTVNRSKAAPARQKRSAKKSPSRPRDAIAMLREDHARVRELFERFEKARGDERKEKLVEQICQELEIHTRLEEEIFYPAVRAAIGDDDLMDEATVEHQSAKDLIAQLREMSAGDDLYDAKVTVLGEYVEHHVKEEHGEMFPKARDADVDLVELGEQMRARKEALSSSGLVGKVQRMLS